MPVFNVIERLRAALRTSDDPVPARVARQVAAEVPDELLRTALTQALTQLASTVEARERSSIRASNPAPHYPSPTSYTPPSRDVTRDTETPAQARSRWEGKSGAATAYKATLLDRRITLPDGTWKFLRDCTAANLRLVAGARRDLAAKTIAQAEWHEKMADLIERRGVTTAGQLPEADLKAMAA